MRMVELSICNRRFTYVHDRERAGGAIDTHHVFINRSKASGCTACLSFIFLVVLVTGSLYLLFGKDNPAIIFSWSCLLSGSFVIFKSQKSVTKESVIIMPVFGVQLETHYSSGRYVSRFIPIHKILKPVLVECVTPVTCYWSLSLLLRGEEQLTLVFKELRPPMKMLVPIWKALCSIIDSGQDVDIN
ncbi:PREDICTED: uncharacterized protein LOC104819716 [Tarenaya hassleriana]|uniref:uncharacterized protein LOC104819716 n=1 Tax=Tarenaya hassleriana TaxID=28532 RepID=UPI00053CA8E3|nr:PREDICTED: uncharacterized protein LOC104819716 [Tarenaya hassleriana]